MPLWSTAHSQTTRHYNDTLDCDVAKTDPWKQSGGTLELSRHVFNCSSEFAEILKYTTQNSASAQFVAKDRTRVTFKRYVHIRGNKFIDELDGIFDALTSFSQETYLTFEDGFDIGNNSFNGELQLHKLNFFQSDSLANKSGFGYNSLGSLSLNTVFGEGELWITNNTFRNDDLDDEIKCVSITNGSIVFLNLTENRFLDAISFLDFEKTHIAHGVDFTNNSFAEKSRLNFTSDTVNVKFSYSNNKGSYQEIIFQNCLIDCPFTIIKENSNQIISLKFINCAFNSNTSMENLQVDTVVFQRCVNIPFAFPFSSNNFQTTIIEISNSKVENILLDYSEKLKLVTDANINLEAKISTYETMLEKFRKEGRLVSYKNLDIEYKQFKYRQQGFIGSVENFIDKVWWNYSHSKFYKRRKRQTRKLIEIFLYSGFIFFSLKIDFKKLALHRSRYTLFFFVQYIIGLACVFFIANAILKI